MSEQKLATAVTRSEIEDFLYKEADLLDNWQLDDWFELLAEGAEYYVPPNDKPEGSHRNTLFLVADDYERIKGRVKRLKSSHAHAENPKSRTRRMINNVRITKTDDQFIYVKANFTVFRFRRYQDIREYIGIYEYKFVREGESLKIAERKAILDSEELGALGSVSILL